MYVVELLILVSIGTIGLVLLLPLVVEFTAAVPSESGSRPLLGLNAGLMGGAVGFRLSRLSPGWGVQLLVAGLAVPFARTSVGVETPAPAVTDTGSAAAKAADKKKGKREDEAAADDGHKPDLWARATQLWGYAKLALPPGLQLLGALVGFVSLRRIRIRGCVGLGDPALTGQLYGLLSCLRAATAEHGLDVDITPEFRRRLTTGHVAIVLHLHLAYLVAVIMRCGLRVAWRWTLARLASLRWWPPPT